MTKTLSTLLVSAFVVGAPLALTACETETQTEIESDGDVDRDVEYGIDDDVEAGAAEFGNEVEDGARQVGNDIEDAAQEASDAIDNNIDLGDNAGTPEVDDNN